MVMPAREKKEDVEGSKKSKLACKRMDPKQTQKKRETCKGENLVIFIWESWS